MRRPRFVRASARFLLAVLVLAQGMLAFAGCDMPERSAALAIAASGMPCHEPTGETTLCLAHCLAEDQNLDKASFFVPALGAAPVLMWRLAPQSPPRELVRARLMPPQAAAPPRILFQSLLI